MTRHFFSGGMMLSDDLPLQFQERLKLVDRWRWNGQHYERALNTWLDNMDRNRLLSGTCQVIGSREAIVDV